MRSKARLLPDEIRIAHILQGGLDYEEKRDGCGGFRLDMRLRRIPECRIGARASQSQVVFHRGSTKDEQMINDAVNKIIAEKLNAKVTLVPLMEL